MVQRKPTVAVAVIVVLLLSAVVAAIALATTSQEAVAQQGCTGGGSSPSPSASPSPSESEEGPIPSILPSLIPDPAPKKAAKKAADPAPLPAPDRIQSDDAADQQQRSCRSTITLAYKSGRSPKFTGAVNSDEPMCKRARNVTIKKVKRGADPTVAKATTNTRGRYTAPARKANGRFYAKVSAATTENRNGEAVRCSAARSRAIKP